MNLPAVQKTIVPKTKLQKACLPERTVLLETDFSLYLIGYLGTEAGKCSDACCINFRT